MTSTEEAALETIQERIGYFNTVGRSAVLQAIEEDIDGALALAERIQKRAGVNNPPGLYLSCISNGDHQRRAATSPSTPKRIPPAEAFRRLYNAKMRELRDVTTWTNGEMTEYAIDYAASYTPACQTTSYAPGQNIITIENDLRREIGAPRHA